jgi:hypothetical protein
MSETSRPAGRTGDRLTRTAVVWGWCGGCGCCGGCGWHGRCGRCGRCGSRLGRGWSGLSESFGLFGLLVVAALCGCTPTPRQVADGRDPLRSLGSAAESRLYDLAYWARVERSGARLWQAAVAFCAGRPEARFPNCRNVRMAGWWSAPPPLGMAPRVPVLPLVPGGKP